MTNTEIAAANKIMLGTTEVAAMYIGSMLIWQNTGLLPSGYTEVEYIESSGNSFIVFKDYLSSQGLSGFELNTVGSELKFQIKYNVPGSNLVSQAALYSINNDYGPTLYYNGSNGMYWKFPQPSRNYFEAISVEDKISDYNIDFTAEITYRCKAEITDEAPVLFARGNIGNYDNSDRKIKAKLYYFKMYRDDTLILDCIPCINSDGVVGIYELVHRFFLGSHDSANNFTAGPTISS